MNPAAPLNLGKWAIASVAGTSSSYLYILLIILTFLYTVLPVGFITLHVWPFIYLHEPLYHLD